MLRVVVSFYEGVAKAFGENVQAHPTLVDLVKRYFGDVTMDSPQMKLAHVSN